MELCFFYFSISFLDQDYNLCKWLSKFNVPTGEQHTKLNTMGQIKNLILQIEHRTIKNTNKSMLINVHNERKNGGMN